MYEVTTRSTNMMALGSVRKFIPLEVMVNIYKVFMLPHFEYRSPVLVGLSSGLSINMELINQYAIIRSVMNVLKSSSHSDLLTHVDFKTQEHRR